MGEIDSSLSNFIIYGTLVSTITYCVFGEPMKLISNIGKYLWYSPGEGSVTLNKRGKKKYGVVNTELGELKVPIMKMSSFENVYGFFKEDRDYPLGMMPLDNFYQYCGENFPSHENFKTIGDNLILNYRKPSDFMGKENVYGFIKSDIDDLIYVYKVDDNQFIDYEIIDAEYCEKIENYQPPGKMDPDMEESIDFLRSKLFGDNSTDISNTETSYNNSTDISNTETSYDNSTDMLKSQTTPDEITDDGFFKISEVCTSDSCSKEYSFDREYRIDDPNFKSCMDTIPENPENTKIKNL